MSAGSTAGYVPRRGDLVRLSFSPQKGSEQAGMRPALVLSNSAYNARTGMMLCCPVTSSVKGYSTEIALPEGLQTHGVVLASQLRALDWRVRIPEYLESVPDGLLERTLDVLIALLED